MCPVVSADVRGGERLRDKPKERLRRRLKGWMFSKMKISNIELAQLT